MIKNLKGKLIFPTLLLFLILLLSSISAVWYNPFSWSIFNLGTGEGSTIIAQGNNTPLVPEWHIVKQTGEESNYDVIILNPKEKKTDLCFVLKDGVNISKVNLSDKKLYNVNGSKILDNKNKEITLKYESSKCNVGGVMKDGYHLSLSEAKAVNIDDYIKLGENSIVLVFSVIKPSGDVEAPQNSFFPTIFNVSCSGGNCDNLSVGFYLNAFGICSPTAGICGSTCEGIWTSYFGGENWYYDTGYGNGGFCYEDYYSYYIYSDGECDTYLGDTYDGDCATGFGMDYWYCPSYEKNGEVAVNQTYCYCFDYGGGCSEDVNDIFNFSNSFFSGTGGGFVGGLIPESSGNPFYVNSSNPYNFSLTDGQSQEVTFWTNATGTINQTFSVYGYILDNESNQQNSDTWNIKIVDAIYNEAPNTNEVKFNTSTGNNDTLEDITCWANATSYNGSSFDMDYYVYKDGVQYSTGTKTGAVSNAMTNVTTISYLNTEVNQNWSCKVKSKQGDLTEIYWLFSNNLTITGVPATTITYPSTNNSYNTQRTINWTPFIAGSWTYYVWVNGTLNATTTDLGIPFEYAGYYYVKVGATDGAGHWGLNSSEIYFKVDLSQPFIEFVSPTPPNATTTENKSFITQFNISGSTFAKLIYNFNSTNYTLVSDKTLLYLPLNNVSAIGENQTLVKDISINGATGTAVGNAQPTASGKFNGGWEFDGNGDKISIPDSSAFNNIGGNVTFSVWVYIKSFPTTYPYIMNIFTDEVSGSSVVYRMGSKGQIALKQRFGINYYDGGNRDTESAQNLSLNTWYHLVATTNGTHLSIYINGVLDSVQAYAYEIDGATSNSWGIGAGGGAGTDRPFNGTMDELFWSAEYVTQEQVQKLYQSTLWKHSPTDFTFWINNTDGLGSALANGTYYYQGIGCGIGGICNSTDLREICIGECSAPPSDTTPPVVTIITPTNNTNSSDFGLDVNYTATDDVGVEWCWWTDDEGANNYTSQTCDNLTDVGGWVEGINTIWIFANDSAGNEGRADVTFRIDHTAPYFTELSNKSVYDNESFDYTPTASDSGIGYVYWYINDTSLLDINENTGQITNNSQLTEGFYIYIITINDSLGNLNTSVWTLNVSSSAIPDTTYPQFSNMDFNVTNASEYSVGMVYLANATITNTNGTAGIEFNGVNYSATNTSDLFESVIGTLGAGTYTYYWWAYGNGTENLLNVSETDYYVVEKNSSLVLGISGTSPITYGTLTDVAGSGCPTELVCSLNESNDIFGVGVSPVVFNYSTEGNDNFTATSITIEITINQATPSGSLSGTSPITYGTAGDVYSTAGSSGDGGCVYDLYRNNTIVSDPDTEVLGVGVYGYVLNTTGCENYSASASMDTFELVVNQNTDNCQVLFNETSPITYPEVFLVWSDCTSDFTLYLNGSAITNNSEQGLGAGAYNFSVQRTDTENYTNIYDEEEFVINKANGVIELYLNGGHSNIEIDITATASIEGQLDVGTFGVLNLTINGEEVNSTTELSSITYTFDPLGLGNYIVELNYSGDENYTSQYENHNISVVHTGSPVVTILYPVSQANYSSATLDLNYSVDEPVPDSCWYSTDGGATNSSSVTSGENFTGVTTTEMENTWTVYCNDTAGNIGFASVSFYVDTTAPYFTFVPDNQSLTYGESLLVNFTAEDNWRGVDSFYINWSDTFEMNPNGTLTNSTILPAGVYNILVYVNDTINNTNSTYFLVTVNQADAGCYVFANESSPITYGTPIKIFHNCSVDGTLEINGSTITNNSEHLLGAGAYNFSITVDNSNYTNTYAEIEFLVNRADNILTLTLTPSNSETYGTETTATCSATSGTPNLFLNDSAVANPHTDTLGAGTYNYTCNISESANYTANQTSELLAINQGNGGCAILFNETSPITYPNVFLVWQNCSIPATLYLNGTEISNNSVQGLGAGLWNFTVISSDIVNYTSSTDQEFFTINKATSTCSLTSPDVTYPTNLTISGSCDNPEETETLYLEGVEVTNPYTESLPAGDYDVIINVSSSQNYTSASDTDTLTISKGTPSLSLTSLVLWSVNVGSSTTITGSETNDGDSDVVYTLYEDGIEIANPYTHTYNVTGSYVYIYNSTEGQNWTIGNTTRTLIVSSATTVSTCRYSKFGMYNIKIPMLKEEGCLI